MTFQINIDSIASTPTILTGNTVTDLVQATRGNMTIAFIEVCNLHNAAVTVTLERYDGTTSHYLTYAIIIGKIGGGLFDIDAHYSAFSS